jgi:hypothetical protein
VKIDPLAQKFKEGDTQAARRSHKPIFFLKEGHFMKNIFILTCPPETSSKKKKKHQQISILKCRIGLFTEK